jgi:hypothetical protein
MKDLDSNLGSQVPESTLHNSLLLTNEMSCKEGGPKPGEQRFSSDMKQLNKSG